MTVDWMESIDCGFLPAKCCHCNNRPATIWYMLDYRTRVVKGKREYGGDGYKPFCEHCCEDLALGMLRDVVEVAFGKEYADAEYAKMLRHKELHKTLMQPVITEAVKAEIESMKKEIAEREAAMRNIFTDIWQSSLAPLRCVSDADIAVRMAQLIGCPVDKLSAVQIRMCRIKGPGVELVPVPATKP